MKALAQDSLGCIYVVVFDDKTMKIGRSVNPNRRIRDLSTLSGRSIIKSFVTVPHFNHKLNETAIHKKFSRDRTFGEYFNSEFETVVEFINTLEKKITTNAAVEQVGICELAWYAAENKAKMINDAVTICERKNMLIAINEAIHDANEGVCDHKTAIESLKSIVERMLDSAISDQTAVGLTVCGVTIS